MGLSVLLALVFVGEAVLFILLRSGLTLEPLPALSPEFASPAAIGTLLFDQYLLPFESTAILLLVAVIGAVFLTRQERVLRPGMSATTPTSTPISPTETTPIFPPPEQRETESTR
jgi:NADH-quinone oxidoreductase subunit J